MGSKESSPLKWLSYGVRGAVAVLVIGLGIGVAGVLADSKPDPVEPEDNVEVPLVQVYEVRPMEAPRVWRGYGTARARRAADVGAEVAGLVLERPDDTEAGRQVVTGQVLLTLDARDLESQVLRIEGQIASVRAQLREQDTTMQRLGEQVELAEDEVTTARRDYERAQEIAAQNAATESEIDNRRAALRRAERTLIGLQEQSDAMPSRISRLEAELTSLEADLARGKRDIARSQVEAPFDGRLQEVFVEAGERVAVGQSLVRLVDLSRVEVPVRLPVSAVGSVSVGDRVVLTAEAAEAKRWEGRVARIAPEADSQTRTVTVFAEVEQEPTAAFGDLLLPGQFVEADVEVNDGRRRLVVPRRVIDGDRVLTVRTGVSGGEASKTQIEAKAVEVAYYLDRRLDASGLDERDWAVVTTGLSAGDLVITSGRSGLVAGREVRLPEDGGSGGTVATDGGSEGSAS